MRHDFKAYDCSTNKTSDSRNAIYKDITEYNYAILISFRLLNPYAVILPQVGHSGSCLSLHHSGSIQSSRSAWLCIGNVAQDENSNSDKKPSQAQLTIHFSKRNPCILLRDGLPQYFWTLKYTEVWNIKYQFTKWEAAYAVCYSPCVPMHQEASDPELFRHFILQKPIIYLVKDWKWNQPRAPDFSMCLLYVRHDSAGTQSHTATDVQATRMKTHGITPRVGKSFFFLFLWRDWWTVSLCSPECTQSHCVLWAIFELMVILLPWPKC